MIGCRSIVCRAPMLLKFSSSILVKRNRGTSEFVAEGTMSYRAKQLLACPLSQFQDDVPLR